MEIVPYIFSKDEICSEAVIKPSSMSTIYNLLLQSELADLICIEKKHLILTINIP